MRWPDGFRCPKCGERKHAFCEPRHLFQCRSCRTQTSARAGTIFHKSRTPLAKWFLAMHLITASKNDIAGLELARQLDVKWDTAWLIKQKLLEVMLQRNSMYKLGGDIQVDDAYQGGEKAGKPGRGAANKLPFVIAVATRDGHPIYTHLRVVPGFTKEAMRDYATGNIEAGARVLTDGLACFNGFAEAGLKHSVKITGGGRPRGGDFKWANTGLANVKGAITGTCRRSTSATRHAISRATNGASTAASIYRRTSNASSASPPPSHPSLTARSPPFDEGEQRRYRGNQEHLCVSSREVDDH
jgi:hypothetical protein